MNDPMFVNRQPCNLCNAATATARWVIRRRLARSREVSGFMGLRTRREPVKKGPATPRRAVRPVLLVAQCEVGTKRRLIFHDRGEVDAELAARNEYALARKVGRLPLRDTPLRTTAETPARR
jgi:hypothetical protein